MGVGDIRYYDGHCDTIVKCKDANEGLYSNSGHLDIERRGGGIQFFDVCLAPRQYKAPFSNAAQYIDYYFSELEKNNAYAAHIKSYKDIEERRRDGRLGCLLALEGGEPLEGEPEALGTFYEMGVRSVSLTWNYRNLLGTGAKEKERGAGLTRAGCAVAEEAERLGILLDVSHLNDGGFEDVLRLTKKPFIASHSNARAVCPNMRNLTDSQIKAIAERGGSIGINLYPPFLAEGKNVGLEDIMRHIRHIINKGGSEAVALGTDFDGIDVTPDGIEDCSCIGLIFNAVEKEFGAAALEGFMWRNLDRVLRDTI